MKTAVETYIERAKKDRQNLLAVTLFDVVSNEIKHLKESRDYLEIGEIVVELSTLIELKSELLLLLFSIATFKKEKLITEEEDILEVFSIIKKSFSSEKTDINRKFTIREEEEKVPISRLSKIVREILEKEKVLEEKVVRKNDYSIKEAIAEIKARLAEKKEILFQDFFKEKHTRIEIILMFLAILILAKNKFLLIMQDDLFAPIFVRPNEKRRVQSNN